MEKYEIIGLLGEGSFGRVYKAKQLSDSSFVALKVICKRGRSAKELKGLRGECEIQRYLHHPNIIQMLDSFETKDEIVVITEFAQKELNTILGKEGFLPEERVQPIVWDLVSALYYLHSHRVLHRDLKPQNILIDSQNRAKLCDFGFARNMSTGTHVLTSIKGTPLYMAPELIDEQPYDHNADLWSLGCIIYELLVGAPPFCTASILHLIRLIRHEQIQWPMFISENCISFLKGLLQKNPTKRLPWEEILNHAFVKGHILISDDSANMPLTRALSANTLQAKEQQRKDRSNRPKILEANKASGGVENVGPSKIPKASEHTSKEKSPANPNNQDDVQNNNLAVKEEVKPLLKENEEISIKKSNDASIKLNFITETNPIETDEWLVFLQGSMAEILKGEMMSLLQANLTNIIVSPLRNCNTDAKVISYVTKVLSLPLAMNSVSKETLQQIKKVYLEVKLVPNLLYSSELLLKLKSETTDSNDESQLKKYKNLSDMSEEDLQALQYIYMLITHLVYLDKEYLSQCCDAIVVLNLCTLLGFFISISKNRLQIVTDILGILTHILRIFPENYDLIENVILNKSQDTTAVNFVELLRHSNSLLRERTCFFLLLLCKNVPANKRNVSSIVLSDEVRETLEALMYDSMEGVRNAAERTIEEFKNKEFSK